MVVSFAGDFSLFVVCSIDTGRLYPFPKGSLSFKTPPKRKAVPSLSAVLESDWSGIDGWPADIAEKETVSPRLVAAIGRRIGEEVESRTVPTIQTGWFCFSLVSCLFSFLFFFLLNFCFLGSCYRRWFVSFMVCCPRIHRVVRAG